MNQHRLHLQNPLFSLLSISAFFIVFIFYAGGLATQQSLASFSVDYADTLFIGIILVSIALQFRATSSLVDPIYWILLGMAFVSWFGLKLVHFFFWSDLSSASQHLMTSLAYFLYYSLTIAAIEVKGYRKAKQLLGTQSLLIWLSTFTFTLGVFVFLVLTAYPDSIASEPRFSTSFVFYLTLDIYLIVRWLHLAWVCRESFWGAYFLFALASFNWAIADLIEGLNIAERFVLTAGSWYDWLWYTPYLLVFLSTQLKPNYSQQLTSSLSFTRSHLFNSPITYLLIGFVLHRIITNDPGLFGELNATQQTLYSLWFTVLLLLSAAQLLIIFRQTRSMEKHLAEVSTATQIMQQRLLQQAQSLKDQAASNQTILETTHNAIFTLDVAGKIQSCNPAACRLLGLEQADMIGEIFIEKVAAEGELARYFTYQSYHRKIAAQSGGIEIESLVTNAAGDQVPVHVTLSQNQNNHNGLLVVSLVNISEQKKAEIDALNLKDQFTANISHEFRTPLTIINGVLDNLLSQPKYQDDQPQLATAKRNGLRMIRMVEQLLELSRIANDPLPLAPLNIRPEIDFICQSFSEIAKNQRIDFQLDLTDEAWVLGNPNALEKILFNLLSNAFKYTQQGSVSVSLKQINGCYQLLVKDTGIGMSEQQLGQIFERFHRIDNEITQTVPGVGIGLALVKELCEALRWSITVSSKTSQGTEFNLSMPVSAGQKLNQERQSDSTSIQSGIASEILESQMTELKSVRSKSKYSVLIVEDNSDMQQHINNILSPYHQCLLASNGEEGIRLAMDYLPDIIISDVMMPGISGFELLKSLKTTEMTSHIPVILLTARGDSASKIRGLQAEADDYLSKPFDADELRLRVSNQLNSRQKLQVKLASQWQQVRPEQENGTVITDKFITKLEDVFEENYQNCDFTLVELSNTLAMSDRQVQRKVKALLGVSPLEALKQFRLKKARVLLERGDQIGVVAQTCGFSSQSYFGRCFKETYQQTPKAFQQSLHV